MIGFVTLPILPVQTITVKQASFTATRSLRNVQTYSVYPNPTSGKVKLKFNQIPQSGIQLSVFDLKGKTILQQLIHNQEEWIDLKGNLTGIYFIKTNQKNQSTQKLILK